MNQALVNPEQQEKDRLTMGEALRNRLNTDAGFSYTNRGIAMTSHTPEKREALFEETWKMVSDRTCSSS